METSLWKLHGAWAGLNLIKLDPGISGQLLLLLEKPVQHPGELSLPLSQVEQLLERLGMLTWNVLLLPSWIPSSWLSNCISQWFPWF